MPRWGMVFQLLGEFIAISVLHRQASLSWWKMPSWADLMTASQYRLTPHLSTVNDHLISQAKATECLLPQIFRHWWSWPLAWCMSCPQREGKGEKQSQVSAESPLLIVVCCWTSQQGLVLGGVYKKWQLFQPGTNNRGRLRFKQIMWTLSYE